VGASHQTGWTGLIAKLLQPHGESTRPAEAKIRSSPTKAKTRESALVEA
jgi:hypothetical protein